MGMEAVNTYTGVDASLYHPALATTPTGIVAVWTTYPQDGSGEGIFGQRLTIDAAIPAGIPDIEVAEDAAPVVLDLDEYFLDANLADAGDVRRVRHARRKDPETRQLHHADGVGVTVRAGFKTARAGDRAPSKHHWGRV